MTAEELARAIGGHRAGSCWMARCPSHPDTQPSLSIRDGGGRVLVRCHAGCAQRDVIAALEAKGLWRNGRQSCRPAPQAENEPKTGPDGARRREAAFSIWRNSVPAAGSLAEIYLASRGLRLPPSPALRFHPGLKHPSGGRWPAMIALVARGRDGEALAIHRTYLCADGRGKASVDPAKMMLGPCRGGAVRLAPTDNPLMVGEGIETCISALQATGHPAWAALSTSGLKALDLPDDVRDVIVLADGDDPGEAAARAAARRWRAEGRHVRIARPPRGLDFNDVLLGRAPSCEEAA